MTDLVALSVERHSTKGWKNVTEYSFAAQETVIPIVSAEFHKVVPAMPIGFIEQEDGYRLVAVTSLIPEKNLYVSQDGRWLVPYIPATLRAYPFALVKLEDPGKSTLCVNERSGLVVDGKEGGHPFFENHGEPTQKIKGLINFLSRLETNRTLTQRAVNALADAGVITSWELTVNHGEETSPVNGLFRVDQDGLNNLSGADFLTLREAGGILVAYAQVLSMNQLVVLERLHEIHNQVVTHEGKSPETSDLSDFSLSDVEGSLNFD